jgi:hypothetical protein
MPKTLSSYFKERQAQSVMTNLPQHVEVSPMLDAQLDETNKESNMLNGPLLPNPKILTHLFASRSSIHLCQQSSGITRRGTPRKLHTSQ